MQEDQNRVPFYRFTEKDVPENAIPWPAQFPLPQPLDNPDHFKNIDLENGIYTAYWEDGQLRFIGEFKRGILRSWLSLWQGVAKACVDEDFCAQMYRPDQTVENFSPWDDLSSPKPTNDSYQSWVSDVLAGYKRKL